MKLKVSAAIAEKKKPFFIHLGKSTRYVGKNFFFKGTLCCSSCATVCLCSDFSLPHQLGLFVIRRRVGVPETTRPDTSPARIRRISEHNSNLLDTSRGRKEKQSCHVRHMSLGGGGLTRPQKKRKASRTWRDAFCLVGGNVLCCVPAKKNPQFPTGLLNLRA